MLKAKNQLNKPDMYALCSDFDVDSGTTLEVGLSNVVPVLHSKYLSTFVKTTYSEVPNKSVTFLILF
jgi:hypothetical protein